MPQIDSLLKMLTDKDGDELRLELDQSPSFYRRGEALKITFPVVSKELLPILLEGLFSDDQAADFAAGSTVSMTHARNGTETFDAELNRNMAVFIRQAIAC